MAGEAKQWPAAQWLELFRKLYVRSVQRVWPIKEASQTAVVFNLCPWPTDDINNDNNYSWPHTRAREHESIRVECRQFDRCGSRRPNVHHQHHNVPLSGVRVMSGRAEFRSACQIVVVVVYALRCALRTNRVPKYFVFTVTDTHAQTERESESCSVVGGGGLLLLTVINRSRRRRRRAVRTGLKFASGQ